MDEQNSIVVYDAPKALWKPTGKNYSIGCGNNSITLNRDVDFANPTLKSGKKAFAQPILLKAGAEKIVFGYGLTPNVVPESKIENTDPKDPFFMYVFRCDLIKHMPNGEAIVITSSYGSANTKEKRNGFNSPYDSANSCLKMAQKRAYVGAALMISGLSDLFTQDIENETFMVQSEDITKSDPNECITSKQVQRLYAIAANAGLSTEQARRKVHAMGYAKTNQIKQSEYDKVCEEMAKV